MDVTKDREKYIGGSDIPAIMGISPFRTRFELLREKALGEMGDFSGNEYTEYGHTLEPKIRDFVNAVCQRNFIEDKFEEGMKRYHADGHDKEFNEVLECKTTGSYDDKKRTIYLAQLLYGMQMCGAENGVLAVYDRPVDFDEHFDPFRLQIEHIHIKDHTSLLERVNDAVDTFIEDVEKMRQNPNLTESDLLPATMTALAYRIEELENKLKEYKAIEKEQAELKETLRMAMNENAVKTWETPNGTKITLVLDSPDKEVEYFDADALLAENPGIYKEYVRTKTQKGRKGYVKITFHES